MSGKVVTIKSSARTRVLWWRTNGDIHDFRRGFDGGYGAKRGSAQSLQDAVELCKAATEGNQKEVSIEDA